jgi:hypothetical protein
MVFFNGSLRSILLVLALFVFLAPMAFASNATIAYATNNSNIPSIRSWNSAGSGSWGPAISLPSSGAQVNFAMIKASPVSSKLVLITLSSDNNLDSYVCMSNCNSSASWQFISNIGSVGASTERRYDVEFETSTGDAIVVYGVNSTDTSRDLAFKVLPATSTNFSGIPEQYINDTGHSTDLVYTWVRLDRKPTSSEELILTAIENSNNHMNAWVWDGSAFGNQIEISSSTGATNAKEGLAVRYAADGSKGMAIGANGSSGAVDYRYWNGASWSSVSSFDSNGADTDDVHWINLKADPVTDDLQAVMADSANDSHTAYWNGSTWNVTSNIETNLAQSAFGDLRPVDFEWNPSGSTGRLVWDNGTSSTRDTLQYQRDCTPRCTSATTAVSIYTASTGGRFITLYRNPTDSDTVNILAASEHSPVTNTWNLTSFSFNGTNYTKYGDSAITNSGLYEGYESYSIAFQLNTGDGTPPVVISNLPSNNAIFGTTTVDFNFTATDNNSTSMNCALLIDGVRNATNSSVSNNNLTNLQAIGISQGKHTWNVTCNDSANNTGTSAARNFTVDTSPPSVNLNQPAPGALFSSSTVIFNFTAVDTYTPPMNCSLYIDGIYNKSNAATANSTPTTLSVSGISDGVHTWNVSCTDQANNTGSNTSRNFTVDTNPPTVQLDTPDDGGTVTTSTVDLQYFTVDALSATMNCSLFLDGVLNGTNPLTINNTITIFTVSNVVDGQHNWSVSCRDLANNTGNSALWIFYVDTTTNHGGANAMPTLTIDLVSNCSGNTLTVMSGSAKIAGARVLVDNADNYAYIALVSTDSNGQLTFDGCSIPVRIRASKDGYKTLEVIKQVPTCEKCVECVTDNNCPDSKQCIDQKCVALDCGCGAPQNHKCVAYQCCADTSCAGGQICDNHVCVKKLGCVKNSDCADVQSCDAGICRQVTGCGTVANHVLTPYQCGDEAGCASCGSGKACINHACTDVKVTGPTNGSVGQTVAYQVALGNAPCSSCDVRVTLPDGSTMTGKTDANGNYALLLEQTGTYTISIMKNGQLLKTITINAPRAQPSQPGAPGEAGVQPELPIGAIVVVLVILLALAVIWMAGKKSSGKPAKHQAGKK